VLLHPTYLLRGQDRSGKSERVFQRCAPLARRTGAQRGNPDIVKMNTRERPRKIHADELLHAHAWRGPRNGEQADVHLTRGHHEQIRDRAERDIMRRAAKHAVLDPRADAPGQGRCVGVAQRERGRQAALRDIGKMRGGTRACMRTPAASTSGFEPGDRCQNGAQLLGDQR
jgi:hypothetical protein